MDSCGRFKKGHIIPHEWCLFPQNYLHCFKVEVSEVLIIKKNLEMIRRHEKSK